jgi:serine protease Do
LIRKLFTTQLGWAVLAGIAVGAAGMGIFLHSASPAKADPASGALLAPADLEVLAQLESAQVKLADRVSQSVVHVENGGRGEGAGVVYRADGYIITNEHVVSGAEQVDITFADGRAVKGKVLRDDLTDLAVVKVERTGLKAAVFADSEQVKPGMLTVAVGSPFGLQQTVTFGNVSAVGRTGGVAADSMGNARPYFDMIQTDAAINPGNSGGPLLNFKGEVIGINSAINTMTGQNSGIGFAIPSNMAKVIADQLIATGKVVRAYMGLVPANMLPYEAEEKGVAKGALVKEVNANTPAAAAGIKPGDVITQIGQSPVRGELDVRNAMILYKPGADVAVTYIREGKSASTNVKLADRPADLNAQQPRPSFQDDPFGFFNRDEQTPQSDQTGPASLGIHARPATAEELKGPGVASGIYIVEVEPGSVASRAGMRPGSILIKVGETNVETPEKLKTLMSKFKKGDTTTITFARMTSAGAAFTTLTVRF